MRSLLFGLAAALMLQTTAVQAQAQDTYYGMVAITNTTNLYVTYDFRWGDGGWQTYVLAPGELRWHSWPYAYANENYSPVPQVRFDFDLTSGVLYEEYCLEACAAPCQLADYARQYVFEACGYLLDLYSID